MSLPGLLSPTPFGEWSNDLVPIASTRNKDSLVSVLLLCIYEMTDPSRGLIWELLDLAAMITLKLGWHLLDPTLPLNLDQPPRKVIMGALASLMRMTYSLYKLIPLTWL